MNMDKFIVLMCKQNLKPTKREIRENSNKDEEIITKLPLIIRIKIL